MPSDAALQSRSRFHSCTEPMVAKKVSTSVHFYSIDSLEQLPTRVDVAYCSSLMSFQHARIQEIIVDFTRLILTPTGARLFPPLDWDAFLERKDQIYARLSGYMLPAAWINTDGHTADELSALLLVGKADGRYILNGAASFTAQCCAVIDVVDEACTGVVTCPAACTTLAEALTYFIKVKHQICVGLQPHVPEFAANEVRFWYTEAIVDLTKMPRGRPNSGSSRTSRGLLSYGYHPEDTRRAEQRRGVGHPRAELRSRASRHAGDAGHDLANAVRAY